MSQPEGDVQIRYRPGPEKKTGLLRRLIQALVILVWLVILLIPGFFIYMTLNNELTIPLGDVPASRLRVWLVSEPRQRGFGLATGAVASEQETSICVQTDLRYLLWQGSQAPSQYCECFQRANATAEWSFSDGYEGPCATSPQESNS